MFKKIAQVLIPFSVIAAQLTRIADLYELELRERVCAPDSVYLPVIPITQEPQKGDTTVTYGEDQPKSKLRRLMDGISDEEEDADPFEEDTLT